MIRKLEIIVGYSCNFRCSYCYEQCRSDSYDSRVMSSNIIDLVNKRIDEYYHTKLNKDDTLQIIFFGGENLLHTRQINEIIKGCCNKNILFRLVTNGSLVDKHKDIILHWQDLLDNKLSVLVSYDYILQDINRCKNTYDLVRNNILWLDRRYISISTNTTFTSGSESKIYDCFIDYTKLQKELRHNKFKFRIGMDGYGDAIRYVNLEKLKESLQNIQRYIFNNPEWKSSISYKYGKVQGICSRYHNCGLGDRVLGCIDYDGKMYPCQGFVYDKFKEVCSYGHISMDFDTLQVNKLILLNKLNYSRRFKVCEECSFLCKVCPLNTIKDKLEEFNGMPEPFHCRFCSEITKYLG